MEVSGSDRELVAVMRQYFAAKAELESLKEQLEAARQAAGEAIAVFYDPRQNAEHAADLQRSHRFRGEMALLMQRAEGWGRAILAADRNDTSEAEAEPDEWQSLRGEPMNSSARSHRLLHRFGQGNAAVSGLCPVAGS